MWCSKTLHPRLPPKRRSACTSFRCRPRMTSGWPPMPLRSRRSAVGIETFPWPISPTPCKADARPWKLGWRWSRTVGANWPMPWMPQQATRTMPLCAERGRSRRRRIRRGQRQRTGSRTARATGRPCGRTDRSPTGSMRRCIPSPANATGWTNPSAPRPTRLGPIPCCTETFPASTVSISRPASTDLNSSGPIITWAASRCCPASRIWKWRAPPRKAPWTVRQRR